jgi:hypothetical protein
LWVWITGLEDNGIDPTLRWDDKGYAGKGTDPTLRWDDKTIGLGGVGAEAPETIDYSATIIE